MSARLGFAALALCLLAGCASFRSAPPLQPIATTQFDRYVVVTLRNPQGPVVPRAGSTVPNYEPGGTYSLSPATRATAKAVADAHGLREVTSWPIALLEVHCLVYEVPAGVDRKEIALSGKKDLNSP